MGPEALWQSVQGQLLFVFIAIGGATLLPGRTLAQRIGLARGRLGASSMLVAVLGFLALSNAAHGAVLWLGLLEGTTLAEIDRVVQEQSPAHPVQVWLAFALVPALGEELLFRGFLQRLLGLRWPGMLAVLGSAVVFGAAHLDVVHGTAAALLGLYLGAVAERAQSVRPTLLCHVTNNSLAIASSAGLVPEVGTAGAPLQIALGLALAGLCLGFGLRTSRLQPAPPSADEQGDPAGRP